ncbi:hypothetical protein BO221_44885 [Archangium sp. Cb G35]|uniref:hypothetical protein n=1 Tax=Archangium sp. Cb G35 TaxID=1920190 RepID=UPI000936A196|nr:hypothetical protein [Archangium sp. Cb G35]OJT17695.1 hypothetical protein BO221_44885 [Archangium sp. Cb G35]
MGNTLNAARAAELAANAAEDAANAAEDATKKAVTGIKVAEINEAGKEVSEGISKAIEAIELFRSGDTTGGAAMVTQSIGSFSGMLALAAPPFGAMAAAALGALTSLISAILSMMRPEQESLEHKLKKLISEETLSNAYIAMSAGKAEWEVAEQKISLLAEQRKAAVRELNKTGLSPEKRKELEAIAAGRTWEYLTQNIGWERHKARISASFAALAKKRDIASTEWMALFDITMVYAQRFWHSFESMAGLVGGVDGASSQDAINNVEIFKALRRVVARQLRDDIAGVYFEMQNKSQLYNLWKGTENYQAIYRRIGMTGQSAEANESLGGESTTFAVTPGGTLFASGWTHSGDVSTPVYYGRGSANSLTKAKNTPNCDQVFLGELKEPGQFVVGSLMERGTKLAIASFNDLDGVGENSPRDWSANEKRWGPWRTLDFSHDKITVLSVGFKAGKESYYGLHVLAYHWDRKDVWLFDVVERQEGKLELTTVESTYFAPKQVVEQLGASDELKKRSTPSHCAISYGPNNTTWVQVGTLLLSVGPKGPTIEKLTETIDSGIQVSQARVFHDDTLVCATNKGLYMRYRLNGPQEEPAWAVAPELQTDWFWKQGANEAQVANALLEQLEGVSQ